MGCCHQKNEKILCHCFNISESAYTKALMQNQGNILSDFVVFQTKHNYCNCAELNPKKTCCLKDFKALKQQFKSK
jgi:hypothetical protein